MRSKRCCLLSLPRQEIVTIISLHLGRFTTGQAHTPSALGLSHSPQTIDPRHALNNEAN